MKGFHRCCESGQQGIDIFTDDIACLESSLSYRTSRIQEYQRYSNKMALNMSFGLPNPSRHPDRSDMRWVLLPTLKLSRPYYPVSWTQRKAHARPK